MFYEKLITKNNTLSIIDVCPKLIHKDSMLEREKVFSMGLEFDQDIFEDYIHTQKQNGYISQGYSLTESGNTESELKEVFQLGFDFMDVDSNYEIINELSDEKESLQKIEDELESVLAGVAHHPARMRMREPYREPIAETEAAIDKLENQLLEACMNWGTEL